MGVLERSKLSHFFSRFFKPSRLKSCEDTKMATQNPISILHFVLFPILHFDHFPPFSFKHTCRAPGISQRFARQISHPRNRATPSKRQNTLPVESAVQKREMRLVRRGNILRSFAPLPRVSFSASCATSSVSCAACPCQLRFQCQCL